MLEAKKKVVEILNDETGEKLGLEYIDYSPHADLSANICFKIAKDRGESPVEVAEKLAKKIKPSGVIARVEAKNGFLNFFIDYEKFGLSVLEDAIGKDFGKGMEKKVKIVLEHTSNNPSGPVHVGRLRNSIIGDSLRRILSYAGYKVETRYWVNDVGKQVAIISKALDEPALALESDLELRYKKYANKDDFRIFFDYVMMNKKFEGDEGFQNEVQELIRAAEKGDTRSMAQIKKAASICLKGQQETYERLGFKFDKWDFESEEIESGRVFKVLNKLKKSKFWIRKDDLGAGLDLSSFGIEKRSGLSVCERGDGTTVYLARDVSYHLEKFKHGDVLVNVLGEDHKLEFQELSTILAEILGVDKPVEVVHFSFVNFEGKQLSTRRGETLPVDQLLDEAEEKALTEIENRGIGSADAAPVIGVGAVKYHIIKTAPGKPITFKWEDALSFEGDAAPYIQYAHARSARILEKSDVKVKGIKAEKLDLSDLHEEEENLVRELSRFPEIVEKSAAERKPHLTATYVLELASGYSRFYKECQVLADDEKLKQRRLVMVYAAKNTIKIALSLLGVDAPERM